MGACKLIKKMCLIPALARAVGIKLRDRKGDIMQAWQKEHNDRLKTDLQRGEKVQAVCPKCGANHVIRLAFKWTGNGKPRLRCRKCDKLTEEERFERVYSFGGV